MRPILFHAGPLPVPSYGVMVALGMLFATLLAWRMARARGLSPDLVLDGVFWSVLAGFAGARAAYIALNWGEMLRDPLGAILSGGGGVFLAGLATGLAALAWQARRHGVPLPAALDLFAPPVALAHAFGRVGCFLSGCCYGAPAAHGGVCYPRLTDASGGVVGSWPFVDHVAHGLVPPDAAASLPVHAVQLFEAAGLLVLAAALLLWWTRRPRAGHIAAGYALVYAALRFGLEFLRGDADRGVWAGLATSQWIALLMAAAAVAWLASGARRAPSP